MNIYVRVIIYGVAIPLAGSQSFYLGMSKVVRTLKSLTAREVFLRSLQVKKQLLGGDFWTDGYFSSIIGKHGCESLITKYVENQGQVYKKLHEDAQLELF